MKMKIVLASMIALASGLSTFTYAQEASYFPPERILCQLNGNGGLACNEFNRQYLKEDITNANLEHGSEKVFSFVTASAYFTNNQPNSNAVVFFNYRDANGKKVKLRTVTTSIKPDFKHGIWKKVALDLYVCDTGYMNCLITNLPS